MVLALAGDSTITRLVLPRTTGVLSLLLDEALAFVLLVEREVLLVVVLRVEVLALLAVVGLVGLPVVAIVCYLSTLLMHQLMRYISKYRCLALVHAQARRILRCYEWCVKVMI